MALCRPQRPVEKMPADFNGGMVRISFERGMPMRATYLKNNPFKGFPPSKRVNLMPSLTTKSDVVRASGAAPQSSCSTSPESDQNALSTTDYEDMLSPKDVNLALPPRPITKSSFCQEKVFKKLSGDERRILKCGRANVKQSKESYLLCTIAGFAGRAFVYAETVGTSGMYENEARFLIIDGKSTLKNSDGIPLIELPVGCDIRVYEVEKIEEVQSLYAGSVVIMGKATWRVKSFVLEEPLQQTKENIVFVESLCLVQHAVRVSGSWFPGLQTVHMGTSEMPPLHSFLKGRIHQSKYLVEACAAREGLFCMKTHITPPMRKLCSHCFGENRLYPYMSQPRLLTDDELEQKKTECEREHNMSLENFTRKLNKVVGDSVTRLDCPSLGGSSTPHWKDFQTKKSERKLMEAAVPNPPPAPDNIHKSRKNKCRQRSRTHSTDLPVTTAVPETEVVEAAVSYTSPEVVKPAPIRCNLCLADIQPIDEVYFKVFCLEDCQLFVHKKCLQEILAAQGLHKKREYKEGVCLREECSAQLREIYELSVTNEESLYLKCADKSKLEKKSENFSRNQRKKENSTSEKRVEEQSVEHLSVAVPNEKEQNEEDTMEPVEVPTPPPRPLPEVKTYRPVLPPPKPNRSIPLPVDIDNVIPLVKEKDALEEKYAIPEQQPKKKTKKSNKKKVILDMNFGFRARPEEEIGAGNRSASEVTLDRKIGPGRSQRFQDQGRGDRLQWGQPSMDFYPRCKFCLIVMEKKNEVVCCPQCGDSYQSQVSAEGEIGQGRSHWYEDQAHGNRLQWGQPRVEFYRKCKICLEAMENRKEVMGCPRCSDSYHSQCIRTWLSTNSTCPQCRRNWLDPVAFPALGQTGSVADTGISCGVSSDLSPGLSPNLSPGMSPGIPPSSLTGIHPSVPIHESSDFYRYFAPYIGIPALNLEYLPANS